MKNLLIFLFLTIASSSYGQQNQAIEIRDLVIINQNSNVQAQILPGPGAYELKIAIRGIDVLFIALAEDNWPGEEKEYKVFYNNNLIGYLVEIGTGTLKFQFVAYE